MYSGNENDFSFQFHDIFVITTQVLDSPIRLILERQIFMQLNHRFLFVFIVLLSFFGLGCGGTPKKELIPGPPIPNLNLSGGYDCPQFGFMKLKHVGNQVRGTYEGIRQHDDSGSILGTIEGDLIWLEWNQPGEVDSVILPKKGKGWLRILNGGKLLKGKWGHDLSKENGGEWIAERSEYY